MRRRSAAKLAIGAAVGAGVIALYFSPARSMLNRDAIRAFAERLREPWYGPIVFILAYAVGCIIAVPATIFVVAAGFIWGWQWGGTYAMAGAILGATLSFLIGRFVGEGMLERFGRVGRAVARRVDHAGFRTLLLLRSIPGIPFAVLNYGAGVARVRLAHFVLATALGIAPSNYLFAYCADALFRGTMSEHDLLRRVLTVAAVTIAFILFSVLVARVTRTRGVDPVEAESGR